MPSETLTMWFKIRIRTSALPQRQQSDLDLRVTQDTYLSLITYTKQLLLVTFCYTTAGDSFWTHRNGRTETDGQTGVEVEIVI